MLSSEVKTEVIPTDLTNTSQIDSLIAEAEHKLGPFDILVINAGFEISTPHEMFYPDYIQKVVPLNLIAPMLFIIGLLPLMLKRNRGHIVNISSLAGKTRFPT